MVFPSIENTCFYLAFTTVSEFRCLCPFIVIKKFPVRFKANNIILFSSSNFRNILFYKDLLNFSKYLNYNLADDIVSETFYRAVKNSEIFEELTIKQQKSWLFKTARNIFIDMIRKASHELSEEISEDSAYQNDSYLSLYIYDLKLNNEDKTLLLLRYVYGYNSKEIGQYLKINSETVRSRLFSIRKKLKKEIEYND